MLEFDIAEIWSDFNKLSRPERGTLDDNSNQVLLGPRFNDAIHDWANGYLEKFKFDDETRAMDERAKLLDLHWGRIERDGAQLLGLGSAMTNFAEVLATNVGNLGERWKGDSYEAFKAAMEPVHRKIAEYGNAATVTGESLVNAMAQIRELFQTFAEDSVRTHLHFEVSPPKEWHKVPSDGYQPMDLAAACSSTHAADVMCLKMHSEQLGHVVGHWVTERRWQICKNDPCENNAGRVIIMYDDMVRECQAAIDHVKKKLDNFYGAVKTVTDSVTELYGIALENVQELGWAKAFQSLRLIGGQPTGGGAPVGGDPYPTGGDVAPTGGDVAPTGGDVAPTGGDVASVSGDPGPAVAVEPPQPDPAEETAPDGTEPADAGAEDAVAEDPAVDDGESVKIQDGDRTIGVTSPDGEGRVRVTVRGADGQTKTYDLDFSAASGMPSAEPTPAPDGVEQIPARTDGKCVIQDGPLTITAERPLFSPDSIQLVVDDGSGEPSTYTLDFEDQDAAAPADGGPGTGPSDADATAGGGPGAGSSGAGGAEEPAVTGPAQPAAADQTGTPGPAGQSDAGNLTTTPQSTWHGDQSGSVSGVLVPDLSGEAQLAAAPDAVESQVGGMVGSGVPVSNAPSSGGQESGSRPGSGWSVHGDLFDNAEPVYSMHGVLGDDDGVKN